jgi:hypothetical protein
MAVTFDEQKIGVQPSGTLIRGFKTDLPDVGAAVAKGAKTLGDSIENYGALLQQTEASETVRTEVNKAPLTKDENGQFIRPPVPPTYGPGAAKMYNELLDTRYADVVLQDAQLELNRIQSDPRNLNDAGRATALMQAHVEGVMKTLPPGIAGRVQAGLTREVAMRQGNVALNNAYRDRESAIKATEVARDNLLEQARNALSNGEVDVGNSLLAEARRRADLITANHGGLYTREVQDLEEKSVLASAKLVQVVRDAGKDGLSFEGNVDNLIRVLQGFDKSGSAMGVDSKWVNDNIPNLKQRQALIAQLQQMKNTWSSLTDAAKTEATYQKFVSPYVNDGYRGASSASPEVQAQMVNEWAKRNLNAEKGESIYSPSGAQKVFQQFGFYPEATAKTLFTGVASKDPQAIETSYALYNQLKHSEAIGNSGSTASIGLRSVPNEDIAFLEHYGMARTSPGGSVDAAARQARENLKNSVPIAESERGGHMLKKLKESANDSSKTMQDVHKLFDANLPSGAKWADLSDAPNGPQREMLWTAETMLQYNLKPEAAAKIAVERFKQNWVQDTTSLQGWVRREVATPTIIGTDGKPSRDYTANVINSIVNPNRTARQEYEASIMRDPSTGLPMQATEPFKPLPNKFFLPGGKAIPDDAYFDPSGDAFYKKSGNIKLVPQANGTSQIFYIDVQGGATPIVDEKGQNVQVNFKNAAKMQENHILSIREENARAQRDANIDFMRRQDELAGLGAPSIPLAPTLEVKPAEQKPLEYMPLKPEDVIVPTSRQQGPSPERFRASSVQPTVMGGVNDGIQRLDDIQVPERATGSARNFTSNVEARIDRTVNIAKMVPELVDFSKTLLDEFPQLRMTSGFRHPGGQTKSTSEHTHGNASDFALRDMSAAEKARLVQRVLQDERVGGIGYYPNSDSLHVDFRDKPAAWGQNKSSSSLPGTPAWFRNPVTDWLNNG